MIKIKLIGKCEVEEAIFSGSVRTDEEVFQLSPTGVQALEDYLAAHAERSRFLENAHIAVNLEVYKKSLPESVENKFDVNPVFPVFFGQAFTVCKRAFTVKRVLILRGWVEPAKRKRNYRLVPYRIGSDWFDSEGVPPAIPKAIRGRIDPVWSPKSDVEPLPLSPVVRRAAREVLGDEEFHRILSDDSNTSVDSLASERDEYGGIAPMEMEESSAIPSLLGMVSAPMLQTLHQNTKSGLLFPGVRDPDDLSSLF
jgi:hypothetical protein